MNFKLRHTATVKHLLSYYWKTKHLTLLLLGEHPLLSLLDYQTLWSKYIPGCSFFCVVEPG